MEEKVYRRQVFKGGLSRAGTQDGNHFRYFSAEDTSRLFEVTDAGLRAVRHADGSWSACCASASACGGPGAGDHHGGACAPRARLGAVGYPTTTYCSARKIAPRRARATMLSGGGGARWPPGGEGGGGGGGKADAVREGLQGRRPRGDAGASRWGGDAQLGDARGGGRRGGGRDALVALAFEAKSRPRPQRWRVGADARRWRAHARDQAQGDGEARRHPRLSGEAGDCRLPTRGRAEAAAGQAARASSRHRRSSPRRSPPEAERDAARSEAGKRARPKPRAGALRSRRLEAKRRASTFAGPRRRAAAAVRRPRALHPSPNCRRGASTARASAAEEEETAPRGRRARRGRAPRAPPRLERR